MAASTSTRLKYTPAQIATMTDKTVAARYRQLRSIALKRQARLRGAGYGDTDIADIDFKASRKMAPEQLRTALADVSLWLRDPRSKVRGMRHYVQASVEALKQANYENINSRNLKDFGDFMEVMRSRHLSRIPPSDIQASIYDEASRVGVSGKTLLRNFRKYLDDEDKAKKLLSALQSATLSEGRKRLSSNEVKALLK